MTFDIPTQLIDTDNISIHQVSALSAIDILAEIEAESYSMFRDAVDDVKLIAEKFITVNALSFGKDSTVCLLVALKAHVELIAEGKIPRDKPFVICNIDTGVENHLVQMLVKDGLRQLRAFAKANQINLDVRIGKPPLSKQWGALYLSGLKLISASRLNNDCSVILKIDNAKSIERKILAEYGCQNVVTLLGSRSSESSRRANSIRKFNNDKTAAELIELDDNSEMVFAPIVNWTDDHVWTVLKHAGTSPISKSAVGNEPLFSYAKNHRLLHIIYSDSKNGSCPTSAKRIAGESLNQGGCGGSARTGCYLCAKGIIDKSAEAQATMPRHSVISANILKVRNYIMTVAQDVGHRSWLAKAICQTTGAIALQPNTLNSEIIDKLLWLLCQATHDEYARARRFKKLVSLGREIEDAGYADIMNDFSMDQLDRETMGQAYLEFAQMPLITPMSLELALYISAIHSRDGVKLPPYRALAVWLATEKGERIPYPEVDPKLAVIDDIPDPIMVIPYKNFYQMPGFSLSGLFDFEASAGCDSSATLKSCPVPFSVAKYFVPEHELHKLSNNKTANLAGLAEIEVGRKFLVEPKAVLPYLRFSKRNVKKVSRKNGNFIVLERGRTSLDKPSFGGRSAIPNLMAKLTAPINVYLPHSDYERGVLLEIDDDQNGYDINFESLVDWFQFDGAERAIAQHDEFIALKKAHNEHIYYFSGTAAFESLLRNGVLRINNASKTNLMRIIQRTNYFASLGLLSVCEQSIRSFAHDQCLSGSLVNQYRNIEAQLPQTFEHVLTMSQFRSFKAKALLELRAQRSATRIKLKSEYALFTEDSVTYAVNQYQSIMKLVESEFNSSNVMAWICNAMLKNGIRFFDGANIQFIATINEGAIRYFTALTTDLELVYSLFDKPVQKIFNDNPLARKRLLFVMTEHSNRLNDLIRKEASRLQQAISNNDMGYPFSVVVGHKENVKHEVKSTCNRVLSTESKKRKSLTLKQCFNLTDSLLHADAIVW